MIGISDTLTINLGPLTLHHFFEAGMHNLVLFTGATKLGTPAGVWCGYTPPSGREPGVIQMLYSTRESRGHVGSVLGVTARHSLTTYGELPEGSHDLSCHSFPVQQKLAFTLGQILAEKTANSEDWKCSVQYLTAWHKELLSGNGEAIDITELREGKNYLLEILRSEDAAIPIPDWAISRNSEYALRRRANGRSLDLLENEFSKSSHQSSLV